MSRQSFHQLGDDTHAYTAYLAKGDTLPLTGVAATSGEVALTPVPWSLQMVTTKTVLGSQESAVLTATVNQDVAYTGYSVVIVDTSTSEVLTRCAWGVTCVMSQSFHQLGDKSHTYTAYLAKGSTLPLTGVKVETGELRISPQPWVVSLAVDEPTAVSGDRVVLTATANQAVTYTRRQVQIYDRTTGLRLAFCSSGTTCAVAVAVDDGPMHSYIGVIGTSWDTYPPVVEMANSRGLSLPRIGSPTGPEVRGGSNPALDACAQRCHADPVSSATGELFESSTDVVVAGAGPALAVSRNYSSAAASQRGRFGHGWSDGYSMRLVVNADAAAGSSLATASLVDVIQENGSLVTFTRQADGSFVAPSRVLATLEQLPNGSYVFVRKQTQRFLLDGSGRLSALEDLNGNQITLSYAGENLTRVSAVSGRWIDFTYTVDGLLSGAQDHAGQTVSYRYDAASNLVAATARDGEVTRYAYDSAHRVIRMTLPGERVTTNSYDGAGRVVEQVMPGSRRWTFSYASGVTTVTDPAGSVTIERYSDNMLTSETKAAGTPAQGTWTYTYSPSNQQETVTDPLGRITRYTYDHAGNRLSVTDPLGRTSRFTHDQFGNMLTATDPAGASTTLRYDLRGNLIEQVGPTGATTTLDVAEDGAVSAVTNPVGNEPGAQAAAHRTIYTYTDGGLVQTETAPGGRMTRYDYDAVGDRTSVTSPTGSMTTFGYDAAHRLTSRTEPRGNAPGADPAAFTTRWTHDAAGRVVTMTDPLGRITRYGYDAAGDRTTVTDPAGKVSTSTFNGRGQVLTDADPLGRVTTFTYEPTGLLSAVTDPNGARTTYGYDGTGRQTSKTMPAGNTADASAETRRRHTTTYVYDTAGQPVATRRVDPGAPTKDVVRAVQYDVSGRVTATIDPAGATTTMD